ncbi:MAG TPA: PKD domain-containing protein [Candidatus Saccharimonadales bacterium]|nr:PKD domain-containing protein [Candidatus Saccharimonadales bacterium]
MKKFFIIGFIVVLLVTIPVAVYLVSLTTKTTTKAAPSTVLSAIATNTTVAVGDTVPVDIIADPGANAVSVVKLNISYDSTKLATTSGGFAPNAAAFPTILDPVTYGPCTGNFCTITATLAIGADPTKAITIKTTVGTISFKALATTDQGPTNVTFGNQTTVYSVAQADQASENVLSSTTPLALTVATSSSLSGSPTPTTTVTETPTPTTETSTITPTSATNQPPLCTSLSVDSNTATAGGSINFTANGNSPAATVSKVTFNFGDGNTLDVTDGGGIGTNNVSLQQAHTYATDGAYTATAIMTDVNSLISNSTSCSQVITIGSGSALATNPTTAPATTLPSTGPGDTLVIIGIVGAVLSVIGGLLFFGL